MNKSSKLVKRLTDLGCYVAVAMMLNLTVLAAQVPDLYTGTVLVADQSETARQVATKQAFKQVLVKVSGSRETLFAPGIQEQLGQAERYLERYSFDEVIPYSDSPAPSLEFNATFSNESIDRLLKNTGQRIWGRDRPKIMVWLAVQQDHVRQLVGQLEGDEITQELQRAAQIRGLTVAMPKLDEADKSRVELSDVWGLFPTSVVAASERYEPELILLGRLYSVGDYRWQGEWMLFSTHQQEYSHRWKTQGSDRQSTLTDAMEWTADILGEQLATSLKSQQMQVLMRVNNILKVDDFVALERFLTQLPQVESVFVSELQGDEVVLKLEVLGGAASLTQALSRYEKLAELANANFTDRPENEVQFQWQP